MTFPCQLQLQFVDYLAQSEESVILFHGHIILIWEQGDDLVSKSWVIFTQSINIRKCQDPKRLPYMRPEHSLELVFKVHFKSKFSPCQNEQ